MDDTQTTTPVTGDDDTVTGSTPVSTGDDDGTVTDKDTGEGTGEVNPATPGTTPTGMSGEPVVSGEASTEAGEEDEKKEEGDDNTAPAA